MDLLSIASALWRHKFAVLPVVLLMTVGAYYVMFMQEAVYESTGTLLLVSPPNQPTENEIIADPTLANRNWDNPYTRNYDPGVIITIVSRLVSGEQSRDRLEEAGADRRFLIGSVSRYGFSSPLAEIQGVGSTPEEATQTTNLVMRAFGEELHVMQMAEGVDPEAFIDVRTAEPPSEATLRASDKLRALVAILGLGVVLLFAIVSTGDAITRLRAERDRRRAGVPVEPEPVRPTTRVLWLENNGTKIASPDGTPLDGVTESMSDPHDRRRQMLLVPRHSEFEFQSVETDGHT